MSTSVENNSVKNNYEFKGGVKSASFVLILVGIAALGLSFSFNKTVGWVDFLVMSLFVTTPVSYTHLTLPTKRKV